MGDQVRSHTTVNQEQILHYVHCNILYFSLDSSDNQIKVTFMEFNIESHTYCG